MAAGAFSISSVDPDSERGSIIYNHRVNLRHLPPGSMTWIFVVLIAVVLAFYSTSEYVIFLGLEYIESGLQFERHTAVLEGTAGNPWQYRVLAPMMIESLFGFLASIGVEDRTVIGFISFRMFQDFLVLVMAYALYRQFGLSAAAAVLGMGILAWSMGSSYYDSDLQFNIFFDVLFYLMAGFLILKRRFWLVPIVVFFAALNRETSGVIPLLLLCLPLMQDSDVSFREILKPFLVSVCVYCVVFFGLRIGFPAQQLVVAYGHSPGLDLLGHNLFRLVTWRQLAATLSVVPVVALIGYTRWRPELKLFFWVIVPIWFVVHACFGVMAETRLFLVPQALVFVPGALMAVEGSLAPTRST
jgi:hypothetical protein